MKFLKLAFIYKNHYTLHYVTFIFKKSRHFAKRKTICVTFICTKIQTLCVTQFFIEFLNLEEGGAFLYAKNNALCVTFLHTKILTFFVTSLYAKNNALFVTFFYIFCIVLIPNYKRTYNQSDYIEK